jgi:hypothetical protein
MNSVEHARPKRAYRFEFDDGDVRVIRRTPIRRT